MRAFDVFGRLPDGKPLWIEAVGDLDTAEKHATQLSRIFASEYFIYSEQHGRVIERINVLPKTGRAGCA
jgi:hypothetical protein